ncbi:MULTISPECIES: DUF3800 domain-containing protein [Pseudomonadaceae]|uniref:DUF3800 domain-containing protein n=1 Tax=Pseudomonadaceae TaxID=135621 RepID=UPI0009F22800|nr:MULTISPECIES: DUF3800 domain-containing protein [Pseudomonas]
MSIEETNSAALSSDEFEENLIASLPPPSRMKDLEAEKLQILAAVAGNAPERVVDRVAWILNHYPEARDSDIKCQTIYWRTFQSDLYNGGDIPIVNYPQLQRFNSISRSRAKVQNVLGLFIASPEIRRYRGKLEEEEKQKALEVRPTHPVYCIYGDESGKTSKYLVVGSVWVLKSYDTLKITSAINAKKREISMEGELHFKDINRGSIDAYRSVLGSVVQNSSSLSFKALAVERTGISSVDDALTKMFYHMIIDGVKEEDSSGRAVLPRNMQFRKDTEEVSKDNLVLKDIELQLQYAAASIFDDRLHVDLVASEDSKTSPLMQLADLFVSSVSRTLNAEGAGEGPKDIFAREFLAAFGMNTKGDNLEGFSQCIKFTRA